MATEDLIQQLSMRPKCYITLGFKIEDTPMYPELSGTSNPTITGTFVDIGAVQRIEVNSTRDVNVWRELRTVTAAKPVESYPGLVSYELSLERVALYASNYLEVFGFAGHDIIRQNKAITIKIDMPADSAGKNAATWYIYGVWFKSSAMKFDVTETSDIRIIQSVDAVAVGISSGKQ